jgi:hypothetical protein
VGAKTEERYGPTFSYRWDLLDVAPGSVAEGRRLSRPAAIDLIARYTAAAVYTSGES